MGVHDELAGLVEVVGPGLFDDAESFRAAMDDFLGDDMATRGELNLLVDVVRLGAHVRLADQVGNGARPADAVDVVGDQVARDRGTTESGSARWAVAALGFAAGLVEEEVVTARRAVLSPPSAPAPGPGAPSEQADLDADVVPDPVPAADVAGVPATDAAGAAAPATVPVPKPVVPIRREPASEPAGRRGRVLAAVTAVVVLLAGAGVVLRTLSDDGADDRGGSADDPTTASAPFAPVAVSGGRSRENGVRMTRTYRLSGKSVTSVVELTNVTRRKVTWLGAEVVPKELADHVSKVTFRPRYKGVIEADPIVYWRVTIAPGRTERIRWTTDVPDGATPSDELVGRVIGWHEEAITKETPRIRRALAALAEKGDAVDDPDTPDPPASVTEEPTTGLPTALPPATTRGSDDDRSERTPAPVNHAPRLALGSTTTSERVSGGYAVNGSDPDGDAWSIVSVSGAPPGVGRSGPRSLGGTVSHTAATVTSHKSSIRSRAFTVTVTIQDEHGKRASGRFTWTVRDTHFSMPNYIGKYGNSPNIPNLFSYSFAGCIDTRREVDTIVRQSISAGTPVKWGARATFTYVHHSGDHPSC